MDLSDPYRDSLISTREEPSDWSRLLDSYAVEKREIRERELFETLNPKREEFPFYFVEFSW